MAKAAAIHPLEVRPLESARGRVGLVAETVVVLGITLGRSAVYSLLSIIELLTNGKTLTEQTTVLNPSYVPDRPWLDFAYQVANFIFPLVPVALVSYLLAHIHRPADSPMALIGLNFKRVGKDFLLGFGLAGVIGIPGLGFYLLTRFFGWNTEVAAGNLAENWWTVPVYVAFALMNGLLEEVIVVAYLFTRWVQAGWSIPKIIIVSALVRGSYHLYQGFGGFVGNLVMGVVFGWVYTRTKRVMPLVIAHTLIDIVAFVGYAAFHGRLGWL